VKCFIVDCEQENGAQLYFAESHNQAKCHAANEAGIEYVEVTSCRRKPEYDQYSPGPVPTKVLIEDGWWFECYGCYRTVSSNEMYDDDADKELDGPVYRGNSVWCSTDCQKRYDERQAKRKADEQAAIDSTLAKWPKAKKVTPYMRGDGKECVWFDFGGKDSAQWVVGEDTVSVSMYDVDKWNEFKEAI